MTAQIHEKLIVDGEPTTMDFCPPLPFGHPRLQEVDVKNYKPADQRESMIIFSTACWRGYQGTWEIREEKFTLTGVQGKFRLTGEEPLWADWFTGVLRVPVGARLRYVHMGFGSVYEQEKHIQVEKGVVVATRILDNRGKDWNKRDLAWENLPGNENHFDGDEKP